VLVALAAAVVADHELVILELVIERQRVEPERERHAILFAAVHETPPGELAVDHALIEHSGGQPFEHDGHVAGEAAIVALELVYARRLADKLASSGGVVLSAERIPAPIVNAVMDLAEEA